MPDSPVQLPYYTIHDLPEDTRPRERLKRLGAQSLSDPELLAIVLRSGTPGTNVIDMSTQLLRRYRGLPAMAQASMEDLCSHHGVGEAKASQILAAIELGRRIILAAPETRPQVRSANDVAQLLMAELAYADQEHVKVVLIDTRNYVIAMPTIYKGSLNTAHIRVGELFKEAIRRNAAAMIVAHNHPSGDPTPSPEDVTLTRQIVKAGKLLNIQVLDHLVLGHQRWVSLKEKGLGFAPEN
ncbi:MAG: JAB domain-containing protein [Chloroflexi bacterium]|nr:JAB domain-containing protein [Chloroflexota bacterium]